MNKLKTIVRCLCLILLLSSCTVQNEYEERLSLTTEEFESTVVGMWKCICAGTSYSTDENEEEHISKEYEIPVDLDYVEITSGAIRFKFKSPFPLIVNDEITGVKWHQTTINEITCTREEATISSEYLFDQDHYGLEGYFLVTNPFLPEMKYPSYIYPYGKQDKHADRLIIGMPDFVYFECVRM